MYTMCDEGLHKELFFNPFIESQTKKIEINTHVLNTASGILPQKHFVVFALVLRDYFLSIK